MTRDEADALRRRFRNAGYSNMTVEMILDEPDVWNVARAEQAEANARREQAQSDHMEAQFDHVKGLIAQI